jgi:Holliday junction DNA helicase RuvA
MIALLSGEVALRRPDHVVVMCGGVGYRVGVSSETLRHVGQVGTNATLHTQLFVRDEAMVLYGFHAEQERDLFLMLLAVQSVGPKLAIAVLSVLPARELVGVIAAGDAARLCKVPGVGKRTAERIIVELREKVGAGAAGPDGILGAGSSAADDERGLARQGLLELGFEAGEAETLLARAQGEDAAELIAYALRAARSAT